MYSKILFFISQIPIIIILKVDLNNQNLLKFIKQHKINNNKMFFEFIVIIFV